MSEDDKKEDLANQFQEQFRDLIDFVEKAIEQVKGGAMPDLSDLDGKVSKLCVAVENADKDIGEAVQPLMSEMIAKLDQLAQELNDYQEKIQAQ